MLAQNVINSTTNRTQVIIIYNPKGELALDNIRTILHDLPNSIKSFVVATPDGFFTIYLNQNLSHDQNVKSYLHEYEHIINGDYDKKCSVDLIEFRAHREDFK